MPQHCFPTSYAEATLLSTKILHRQRRLNTHEPIQNYEKRKAEAEAGAIEIDVHEEKVPDRVVKERKEES